MKPPDEAQARTVGSATRVLVDRHLDQLRLEVERERLLDRVERLASLLVLWGTRINLTARPDDPADLAFQIADSLAPNSMLEDVRMSGARVLDLGSGAGFPGLVLASASPARFTLIESRRKRASFLAAAAVEIGLDNVEVLCRRIRPGDFDQNFDVVTSKAFGVLPSLLIAASALRPQGEAILYCNPGQNLEFSADGLREVRRFFYAVAHGTAKVQRMLAVWQKN